MRSRDKRLNLYMNGISIGVLQKQRNGRLSFCYEADWLKKKAARPLSLSLPLRKRVYEGDVVYNFFDNLLPDNPKVRARIQTEFQIVTSHPFDLLESIGRDCVGAIELSAGDSCFSKTIERKTLSNKSIALRLKNYKTSPLGMNKEEDFRISLAGAQEKSAFLKYKGKWCLPLHSTPTTHIFKLPIGIVGQNNEIDLSNSCENEWLCLQIAKAFGFSVADSSIEFFEDVKVLVVERFDRMFSQDKTWLVRLPQEDFCQASGFSPNLKYQTDGGPGIKDAMNLLLGSNQALKDQTVFFRSQVLFYLLAAIDGHAKNFSIFLQPQNTYCLTPLYDIISAHPLLEDKQLQRKKIKMAMALLGSNKHYHWHTIQARHFISTASAVRYSKKQAQALLEKMLSEVGEVIDQVSGKLPKEFPMAIAQNIFDGMRKARDRLI